MKKILFLLGAILLISACASVQEAKNFANCKYSIQGVEVSDYNVNSISFDFYLAITNLNKKQPASIKKFEGKVWMNDVFVADMKAENVRIDAGATKIQKATINVPMKNFNAKLVGLVSMGSASVDYKIEGTAYFDTPLGEVPVPVAMGRRGSNN